VAGKVLSQRNAQSLKEAFANIGKVLIQAGIVGEELLESLEDMTSEAQEGSESEDVDVSAAADSLSFQEEVQKRIWNMSVETICHAFVNRLQSTFNCNSTYWGKISEGKSKEQDAKEALQDFVTLIENQISNPPASSVGYGLALSQEDEEFDLVLDSEDLTREFAISLSTESLELESEVEDEDVAIEASSGNRFPVRGVLFKIDQPSEGIPAVGPGLPLYIPMNVAIAAVNDVNGLPLDADPSLSRHANDNIDGVIQRGEICGDDFIVHGHLWPFNKPEKVQIIAQNIKDLGMSMNANATGRAANISGVDVFKVEKLNILGANILFSKKATFQQTRLDSPLAIAASSDESETYAIAASRDSDTEDGDEDFSSDETNSLSEGISMDSQVILAQLQAMNQTLEDVVDGYQKEVSDLRSEISDLNLVVSSFVDEKRSYEIAAQAKYQQEQKQQERQELIDAVVAAVSQKMPQGRDRVVASQPPRLTTPIAASSNGGAALQNPMQVQLIQAEAKLDALRGVNGNSSQRLQLIEEIKTLKAQMLMG
jgi:hypothetical protein